MEIPLFWLVLYFVWLFIGYYFLELKGRDIWMTWAEVGVIAPLSAYIFYLATAIQKN